MLSILLQVQPVNVTDSFKDTFNFLQGNGVYEDGMMHFLKIMKDSIWSSYDTFIADAQALAAIFMIIFFSIKAYEMMSGDKQLEIMPLLRPFALVMVILWWGTFTKVVAYPTDLIENKTNALFNGSEVHLNDLRVQRAQLIVTVADSLMSMQAQTEVASHEAGTWYEKAWESVKSDVKDGFAQIWNPIIELRNRLQVGLQLLATSLLETLAIWILRICVYIVFFVQIIFSTILIILGPFSVAVSILPAFRDSFTTWVARFISVNLYSGIAYLILYVATQFQQFAMEAEITRFQQLLDTSGNTMEKLGWFASNGILSFGMVIITFLIGGLTMLTVPSISTWIVSTSGITSASSTMGRGASSLGATVTRMIGKM
ncbi:plasmid transfer protein [Mucilaginibacter lacusdianchii]|uniref:plasmid transfer protein n=1 Tax=Mucilaginibacter lacusdianchii TaxID=2684211 RepID=UPI00131C666C|nr:plasmid transfer protein [Mucilaginibacter sp. JXJ CY 39]